MADLVGIRISLNTKQWPSDMSRGRAGINYSGGAEIEMTLALGEDEMSVGRETFEEDVTAIMTDMVRPLFETAGAEIKRASEAMVESKKPKPIILGGAEEGIKSENEPKAKAQAKLRAKPKGSPKAVNLTPSPPFVDGGRGGDVPKEGETAPPIPSL